MGYNYGAGFGAPGMSFGFGLGFLMLIAWSLYWKGRALWRAARLGQFEWFVALLIINTVGILEITYLYYFTKPKGEKEIVVKKEKKD